MSAVRSRYPPLVSWSGGLGVYMPACHAGDRGFKSRPDRILNCYNGLVAQLVEHLIEAQGVGGSIPSQAIHGGVAKWLNAADCKSAPSGSGVRISPPPLYY